MHEIPALASPRERLKKALLEFYFIGLLDGIVDARNKYFPTWVKQGAHQCLKIYKRFLDGTTMTARMQRP